MAAAGRQVGAPVVLVSLVVPALLRPSEAAAARYRVGPGRLYATVEAAINGHTYGPGDTIEIDPGRHEVTQMLRPLGSGQAGRPIVVRGAGMGLTIVSGTRLTNSKALWDVEQGNRFWTFEDLTVAGMRGAQTNARGFFLVACQDVVVQRCEVTDCWNGFMSASGAQRVTVQFCDIHHNGGLQGPAHNLYMNSGSDFVIRHNWIHHAQYGICYKDRTRNLKLLYNRIERAEIEGYEISLAGDGSGDQGEALLLGNLIVKDPGSSQQTHFVRFEDGRGGTLTMIHNTLVGQPRNVLVSSIASATRLDNNVLMGGASVFSGGAVRGRSNWISSGRSVPAGLDGSVVGSTPGFVDAGGGEYRPGPGSACIDAADPGVAPAATEEWGGLGQSRSRVVRGRAPDLGAFEAAGGTPVQVTSWTELKARYR
jgi:hypothetical protein